MADTRAEELLRTFEKAKSRRQSWENIWQQISDLALPERSTQQNLARGTRRRSLIFDDTAPQAVDELAAGLHGLLSSPALRWFQLMVPTRPSLTDDSLAWLEQAENILYSIFNSPKLGFNTAMHEMYLDQVALGTSCMIVLFQNGRIRFQTIPLSEVYILENGMGEVDTVGREFKWSAAQAGSFFGADNLPEDTQAELRSDQRFDREREYVHLVLPRIDRDAAKIDAGNKPWASVWIDKKETMVLAESGFDEMPYVTPRWSKSTGEMYGRSPVMTVLSTIQMLNAMSKNVIQSAEKATNPALLVPDQMTIAPLRTVPNAVNFFRPTVKGEIQQLPSGNAQIGDALIQQRQEIIRKALFLDMLQLPLQDRMTATEVLQRRQDRQQIFSPFVSRNQMEGLSPTIQRTLGISIRAGWIPSPPQEIMESGLQVEYTSPLAVSQRSSEVGSVQQWVALVAPFAEGSPDVLDNFDTDSIARLGAEILNVPRQFVRSIEDRDLQRQARAQQMQQQQMVEQGVQVAGAVKDVAGVIGAA